ncbi:MAG: serine/threonine protein kinase [Deltaproteobacteria bacterium]|nr:serine/threonine protein kinase [Deltaproteobacteria bacterium]
MASASAHDSLREGDSLGGWTILKLLATGGMGAVYAARNDVTGATRALKVIRTELLANDDIRARFVREVSLATRVSHPNVVAAFDPLVVEGRVVLPMELLEGETLASVLGRGPLAIADAITLAITLAGAMSAFHAEGIIHRDLKPANVFLARTPRGEIVPKILDLGAARELAGWKHTQTGHTIGSPAYMAPEQARGERDLDVRVDVYALGVLLYVMLTCKRPVESDAQGSAISKLVQGAPIVPPRAHRPEIPEALEDAILTAMARDRSQRFASAAAFASSLIDVRDRPAARAIPVTRPGIVTPTTPTTTTRSVLPLAAIFGLAIVVVGVVIALGVGWTLAGRSTPITTDVTIAPTTSPPPAPPDASLDASSAELEDAGVDAPIVIDDAGTDAHTRRRRETPTTPEGTGLWLDEPEEGPTQK